MNGHSLCFVPPILTSCFILVITLLLCLFAFTPLSCNNRRWRYVLITHACVCSTCVMLPSHQLIASFFLFPIPKGCCVFRFEFLHELSHKLPLAYFFFLASQVWALRFRILVYTGKLWLSLSFHYYEGSSHITEVHGRCNCSTNLLRSRLCSKLETNRYYNNHLLTNQFCGKYRHWSLRSPDFYTHMYICVCLCVLAAASDPLLPSVD